MGAVLAKVAVVGGADDFVVIEVDDATLSDDKVVLASRDPGKALVEASETLSSSFDRVVSAVSELLLQLRSLPNAPEQAEIQFGLKLGAEVGLIVARGNADVNFQVKLSWQKPKT